MAQLVGVLDTSHVWIGRPPEEWDAVRQSRDIREDVPTETMEERVEKARRVAVAVETLRSKLAELHPDALIVFGDDQSENFPSPGLRLMPMISVYLGEQFSGFRYDNQARRGEQQVVQNHPDLARAITYGLIDEGFDPAYMLDLPVPEAGIGHAVMNPLGYFTDYEIPTVPIVLNAIYAPCLTGKRSNELGKAVRRIVDRFPRDLRVVAIGSGGLWHTTSAPQTWLNEEFDRIGMKYLAAGDIKGWAAHFDGYVPEAGDRSQWTNNRDRGSSGLPAMAGPQFGSREILDWIAASSTAEGSPFTIVDMIQIYSSPIDCTFAYCDNVQ
jgi:hypothetical protein